MEFFAGAVVESRARRKALSWFCGFDYITQRITEQFDFTSGPLVNRDFETNLPLAHMVDPGACTRN